MLLLHGLLKVDSVVCWCGITKVVHRGAVDQGRGVHVGGGIHAVTEGGSSPLWVHPLEVVLESIWVDRALYGGSSWVCPTAAGAC